MTTQKGDPYIKIFNTLSGVRLIAAIQNDSYSFHGSNSHILSLLTHTDLCYFIQIPYHLFESYVHHVTTVNIPPKIAASSVISVKRCWWMVCGCKYI